MKVTDKDYFVDEKAVEKLDLVIERHKYGRDSMFIVDGGEGDGKSTATVGWAYYVAHKMGLPFSVDNVFFDCEEMMKFAATHESQIIIWDEAATSGMAMNWQNKTQQKLIKILMMARKKKHIWFFVIPKFWKLNEYIVDRAIGLFHCYSPDLIKQGYFVYFKKEQKDFLYERMKDKKIKSYKNGWCIRSTFVKKGFVIDEEAYEKKKDAAILSVFKDDNVKQETDVSKRLSKLIVSLKDEGKSAGEIAKLMGITSEAVNKRIRRYNEEMPEKQREPGNP